MHKKKKFISSPLKLFVLPVLDLLEFIPSGSTAAYAVFFYFKLSLSVTQELFQMDAAAGNTIRKHGGLIYDN